MGYAGHLAGWLDTAEVDFAVLYGVRLGPSVETYPLIEEPLWAVGPPGAGLSPDHPVSLAVLDGQPLVLPGPPHALRAIIDHAVARTGITLRILTETNSMTLQRTLAADGVGHTVLPITAFTDALTAGELSAAPFDAPSLRRRLVLAVPSTRRLGPAVHAVSDMLVHVLFEEVSSGRWPRATIVGAPPPVTRSHRLRGPQQATYFDLKK